MSLLSLIVVTVLVLLLPGAALATAAGLRRPVALAVAPLLTYGLATGTGSAATFLQLSWRPELLVAETVVLSTVLWGARRRRRAPAARSRGRRRPQELAAAGGVLLGGLFSLGVLLAGMGWRLDRPNQDWDYTFHANATRFIADTGNVAPGALRAVNDWESPAFFYPNAFHAVAALVRDLTAAPVFSVLNSSTLLLGLLAGLGLAVLLREVGAPAPVVALTPVLLAGFGSFPYDVVWRGPLLPYATGLALTPAFVLLVRALLENCSPGRLLLAATGGAALFGLQPSTALAAGCVALLMVAGRWLGRRRVDAREFAALAACGLGAAVLAEPEVLGSIRTGTTGPDMDWPAVESPAQAVGQWLVLDHGRLGAQLCLAALVLVGLLTLRSARYLWLSTAATLVAVGLAVLASSSDSAVAQLLTRPWWNDSWRLAALAVLGLAPLAAHGAWRLGSAAASAATRLRRSRPPVRPAHALAFLLAGVLLLSGGLYAGSNSEQIATAYRSDRYLDAAEVRAMSWLGTQVEPGDVVMNDPGDGSAYMSALAGVTPVFGHQVPAATYATLDERRKALLDHFHCLDTDPRVRRAITELHVAYVFLGRGFVRPEMGRVPGLTDLSGSPSLSLAYQRGGVLIYRVALAPPAGDGIPGCQDPAT